jgi:phospholipid/cholesterol/gamma-HCH transport system substrate-binding protein
MENKAPYMVVGIFVLVLLFGLTFFVLWLSRYHGDSHQLRYSIDFQGTVTGLKEGGSVLYQGVPVGAVEDITLTGRNKKRVNVIIALDPSIIIKEDVVASIEMKGVTGNSFLQLSGGGDDAKRVVGTKKPPYPVIQARSSSVEKLLQNAPQVLEKIEKLGQSFNEIFNAQTVENIKSIVDNLKHFTAQFSKDKCDVGLSFAQLNQFLQEGTETMKLIRSEIKGTGSAVQKLGNSLQKIVDENKNSLKDFSSVGLYEFSQAAAELKNLIKSLTHLTYKIDEDPMTFLFSDNQKGVQVQK